MPDDLPSMQQGGLPGAHATAAPVDVSGLVGATQVLEHQRQVRAQFDADDADLAFADQAGQMWAAFREQRGMDPTDNLRNYKQTMMQMRDEVGQQLKDPYARKLYESASRRRLESHLDQAENYALQTRIEHRTLSTKNGIEWDMQAIDASFNDPKKVGASITTAVARQALYDQEVLGLKGADADIQTRKVMVSGVERALGAYVAAAVKDPTAAAAGRAFLAGTVPVGGHDVSVAGLLGATAKLWEGKLKDSATSNQGAALAVQLFAKHNAGDIINPNGGEKELEGMLTAGTIDADTFLKAQEVYRSAISTKISIQNQQYGAEVQQWEPRLAAVNYSFEGLKRAYPDLLKANDAGLLTRLKAMADKLGGDRYQRALQNLSIRTSIAEQRRAALDAQRREEEAEDEKVRAYINDLRPGFVGGRSSEEIAGEVARYAGSLAGVDMAPLSKANHALLMRRVTDDRNRNVGQDASLATAEHDVEETARVALKRPKSIYPDITDPRELAVYQHATGWGKEAVRAIIRNAGKSDDPVVVQNRLADVQAKVAQLVAEGRRTKSLPALPPIYRPAPRLAPLPATPAPAPAKASAPAPAKASAPARVRKYNPATGKLE